MKLKWAVQCDGLLNGPSLLTGLVLGFGQLNDGSLRPATHAEMLPEPEPGTVRQSLGGNLQRLASSFRLILNKRFK